MINNPLQKEKLHQITGSPIKLLKNPLSSDMAYLRTSLIPGALETIAEKYKCRGKGFGTFEAGNTFNRKGW
jgi:phenylalanyl-tRNA synthetase beta subunit